MVDAIDVDAPIPYELTRAGQDAADSAEVCDCVIVLDGDMCVCNKCGTGYYWWSDIQHMVQERYKK